MGLSVLVILCSRFVLEAQVKPRPTAKTDRKLARAQSITDDIVKDAANLELIDRAVLWLRLGEAWRRADPKLAMRWFKKAVNELEFTPAEENSSDRGRRLETARTLFSIMAPVDKDLSARLMAIFTDKTLDEDNPNRKQNAKALALAAYEAVDSDPALAVKFASASLRWGHDNNLSLVLLKLRKRDPRLAGGLFNDMLASARATHDTDLLWTLIWTAFVAPQEAQWNGLAPPDTLSTSLLQAVMESVRKRNDEPDCSFITATVAPLLVHYDRLLPAQGAIVRQEVNRCQSSQPATGGTPVATNSDKPQTIDDLISEANDISIPSLRTVTLVRVANEAASQRKFDQAIKILDSVENDLPPFLRGPWQGWRIEWAASSALDHLRAGDRIGMQQVINASPVNLRAQTQILLADKLDERKEGSIAVELLLDGQRYLARDEVSKEQKAYWYPLLVRLAAKYLPAEAPAMLSETVKVLNRIEQPESGADAGDQLWEPLDLAGSLLEIDEHGVRFSVSQLQSPLLRARARLGLLVTTLR